MISLLPYEAKQFHLSGLTGFSDQTLEMRFKLYEDTSKSRIGLPSASMNFSRTDKLTRMRRWLFQS